MKDSDCVEPLDEIIRVMNDAQGLDLSIFDATFLRKAIDARRLLHGLKTVAAYGAYLAQEESEALELGRSLRITYTEFFRNPLTFALLEQMILPGLVEARRKSGGGEIRVWSAGCAAGQEAWSMAMLLDERIGSDTRTISFRLFATDLSESDLALARAGVYSAEEVGNVSARRLRDYFSRKGDSFTIIPRLRERVEFSVYDLLDHDSASPATSIYGDFDLILCCNVLFYYRRDIRRQILDKLCRALSPGGYFVTGEAEKDMVIRHKGLSVVTPPAAVFKKTPGSSG